MNRDTLKGQWKQIVGDVKARWGKLTDDELTQIEGNYDKLIGKIQERYGHHRDQAQRDVDEWLASRPETITR
jgi:uncharacterized protein YjbJ (UPF0337 family)